MGVERAPWAGGDGAGPSRQHGSHRPSREQGSRGLPRASGISVGTGRGSSSSWLGKTLAAGRSAKAGVHRLAVLEAAPGFPSFATENSYDFRNILE